MDYKKAAQQVLDNIGGASNIVSAAHCATRLRLVIADNSKVNKKELENAEGAKGVFEAQGQLQIIFGTGIVNKVYDESPPWPESPVPARRKSNRLPLPKRRGTNGPSRRWAISLFPSSRPSWLPAF